MSNRPKEPRVADGGTFSEIERARYARHLRLPQLGGAGQQRLKDSRVVIVGTGGLGSPVAMYLAAAGVGTLGLVDYDAVDLSNLQRQIIHGEATLGSRKVDSAVRRLADINPNVRLQTYDTPLTSDNAFGILGRYDLIIDGTDNFATRYLLNDAAVMLGKPLVYGSVFQFEGQVSVFGMPDGPCYRCMMPIPPSPDQVPNCADAGVLGVLPGTIGTIQATEAIKLIAGIGEPLAGRLLLYDALDMSFDMIRVPKRTDCPVCGTAPTITELIDYEEFCGAPGHNRQACDSRAGVQRLTPRQIKARVDGGEDLLLVDIRESQELAISSIPEAVHMPMHDLSANPGRLPQDKPVVLFCHVGQRSAYLVEYLTQLGFDNLIDMQGGINAWSGEVDPSIPLY